MVPSAVVRRLSCVNPSALCTAARCHSGVCCSSRPVRSAHRASSSAARGTTPNRRCGAIDCIQCNMQHRCSRGEWVLQEYGRYGPRRRNKGRISKVPKHSEKNEVRAHGCMDAYNVQHTALAQRTALRAQVPQDLWWDIPRHALPRL